MRKILILLNTYIVYWRVILTGKYEIHHTIRRNHFHQKTKTSARKSTAPQSTMALQSHSYSCKEEPDVRGLLMSAALKGDLQWRSGRSPRKAVVLGSPQCWPAWGAHQLGVLADRALSPACAGLLPLQFS